MAQETRDTKRSQEKKVFERPDFKVLGSVTEITRGPSGGAIDSIFGGIGGFTS